jgi:hypothetical protein
MAVHTSHSKRFDHKADGWGWKTFVTLDKLKDLVTDLSAPLLEFIDLTSSHLVYCRQDSLIIQAEISETNSGAIFEDYKAIAAKYKDKATNMSKLVQKYQQTFSDVGDVVFVFRSGIISQSSQSSHLTRPQTKDRT